MAKTPPPLDDEIRHLYQVPLAEFTAGRQALATGLRQAGDPRQSALRDLRKPSLSAWAAERSSRDAEEAKDEAAEAERQARAARSRARAARRIAEDAKKEAARTEATLARARQALARAEPS